MHLSPPICIICLKHYKSVTNITFSNMSMLVTDWHVTNMPKNVTNVLFCHQHSHVTNITVIKYLEETILIIKTGPVPKSDVLKKCGLLV